MDLQPASPCSQKSCPAIREAFPEGIPGTTPMTVAVECSKAGEFHQKRALFVFGSMKSILKPLAYQNCQVPDATP
jgi:hypothetical protein